MAGYNTICCHTGGTVLEEVSSNMTAKTGVRSAPSEPSVYDLSRVPGEAVEERPCCSRHFDATLMLLSFEETNASLARFLERTPPCTLCPEHRALQAAHVIRECSAGPLLPLSRRTSGDQKRSSQAVMSAFRPYSQQADNYHPVQ